MNPQVLPSILAMIDGNDRRLVQVLKKYFESTNPGTHAMARSKIYISVTWIIFTKAK